MAGIFCISPLGSGLVKKVFGKANIICKCFEYGKYTKKPNTIIK